MNRLFLFLTLLFPVVGYYYGNLFYYQCSKCGTVVKSEQMPSTYGCPARGSHQWHQLGKVGNSVYQCRKCGVFVNNERTPSTYGCPQGGSHQWHKLTR